MYIDVMYIAAFFTNLFSSASPRWLTNFSPLILQVCCIQPQLKGTLLRRICVHILQFEENNSHKRQILEGFSQIQKTLAKLYKTT